MLTANEKRIYPIYLIFPALIIYGIFYLGSVTGSFTLSFTDWYITRDKIVFIGLQNFQTLLGDKNFLTAFKNTWIFCIVTTIFKTLFGLIIALVLNMHFKGRNFFRAVFYLPCIFSPLVVGYIFGFILRNQDGLVNTFLRSIKLDFLAKDWLGNYGLALFSVAGIEIWMWTGFCAAIILAGLQLVPAELEEAAMIDGANSFSILKNVRIPFIIPSLKVVLVLNIIGGFRVFDLIMATTNGGPGFATEVFSTQIYKAQTIGILGYATAIGLIQFLIITIIVLPTNMIIRRREIEL